MGEVYIDRILRCGEGEDYYSLKKLGAFGADLGAVACFFAEPWHRPAPQLSTSAEARLFNQVAYNLRALGRLDEALDPMRTAAEMRANQKAWKRAAITYSNLSELQLSLGLVAESVTDGRCSVAHADRGGDAAMRMVCRSSLADALHQQGKAQEALETFAEAESLQIQLQPEYPLLYSVRGFRYCELLSAAAARAAWCGAPPSTSSNPAAICRAVALRTMPMLERAEAHEFALDIALHHLTLARCALYADRLEGRPPSHESSEQAEHAVNRLRSAGAQHHMPLGLLTRAWLRHASGDPTGARADLDKAQRIAERGNMRLHLADIALTPARLFHDRAALAQARRLIEQCGYGRRLPELADAEAATECW